MLSMPPRLHLCHGHGTVLRAARERIGIGCLAPLGAQSSGFRYPLVPSTRLENGLEKTLNESEVSNLESGKAFR